MIFDQLDFKEEKVMDNEKIEKLQQMIDESDHIVFFGGAGVSTESHIPDFRSTDGLYHQTYKYPPEVMVSHTFYTQHTEEFYDFYKNKMIFLDAKPNKAHLKLAEMERAGKLSAIVTQNIDGLHQAAGSKNVFELHGSVHRNYCQKCGKPDGLFTYMQEGREDAAARPSLVGVGVLSLQMCGNGSDSAARKGLDWMLKNTNQPFNWKANNTSSNLYQHYYGVQAAMNRGGDVWKAYNKAFRDSTLGAQATDGSFTPNGFPGPGGLVNSNGGSINDKIYRQCLATLMLEVYYRFLPGTGEGTRNS